MSKAKKAEHVFKNLLLDGFLSIWAAKPGTDLPVLTSADTVVFLRLNRIGDALVSTPLIHFIKQQFGCRVVVVASQANHFIFRNHASVDEVIVYRKGPRGMWNVRQEVQALQPTLVIDLHESLSTTGSILAGLLPAPYKFALRKKNAQLYTHTVEDPDPSRYHVLERLAHIGSLLGGVPKSDLKVHYRVSEAASQKAREYLASKFPGATRYVGINVSAGSEARFWGAENYQRLVNAVETQGLTPVVLTAPADKERITALLAPERVFCSTSFEEFAAVISQLDVLFTPDTSAVHVAAAYHIPVFGIYVAERPGQLNWYPYGSRYDWMITPENVRDLAYDEVWERFSKFLIEIKVS